MNHQQPDRVPDDLGSQRSLGIAATAYPKPRAAIGRSARPRPLRAAGGIDILLVVDAGHAESMMLEEVLAKTVQVG